jgi:hypothetical protein
MRSRRPWQKHGKQMPLAIEPPVSKLLPMRTVQLAGRWPIALDFSLSSMRCQSMSWPGAAPASHPPRIKLLDDRPFAHKAGDLEDIAFGGN